MKSFFLALTVLVFTVTAYSQTKIPSAVKKAFSVKFSAAESVKWEKEKSNEYEAEFKLNGKSCSASFTKKGDWLETETDMQFSDLPEAVQSAFKKNHSVSDIKEVALIETSNGLKKFEVEIKVGKKKSEFTYDSDGNELKK